MWSLVSGETAGGDLDKSGAYASVKATDDTTNGFENDLERGSDDWGEGDWSENGSGWGEGEKEAVDRELELELAEVCSTKEESGSESEKGLDMANDDAAAATTPPPLEPPKAAATSSSSIRNTNSKRFA